MQHTALARGGAKEPALVCSEIKTTPHTYANSCRYAETFA
ncbi:hypothetical protein Z949_826 [Sulfitobacter guttiformis KCTC 32187]|nr:hypothetical protein Z949_826 [Sulfitobacter guttiformis KCTC 32187]